MSIIENPTFNFEEGEVLLIDKPLDWSSFDIVKKIKYTTKCTKIGHAGTLDPLASGLLILCTGKMTKKITEFQDMDKEYEGTLILGKSTPSCDRETEVISEKDISSLNENLIKEAALKFIGKTLQVPPVFSAVKVGGERLYKKARRGEEVKIEAKEISIADFEITQINLPEVHFRVVCSKGTYIRSLVRDLGETLNVGAYMSALRRTRIGTFHLNKAFQIEDFVKLVKRRKHEGL
jgi:tRNA pseudouridine55 synthase